MDPILFRQVSPLTRHGGCAVSGLSLGLFIRVPDRSKAIKAVPIIGEQKTPKETPSLVGPKGESLAKPVVPTKDVRASSQPKLFGPSGQQVHAEPSKPSPFEGSTPKPKLSGNIIQPGAGAKPSGPLVTSPHPSTQTSGPLVSPTGQPVSSRLTEGPGAARPKPTILSPSSGSKPAAGPLVTPSGGGGARSSTSAEDVEWGSKISAAKQKLATAQENEARSRPLDFKPRAQEGGPAPQTPTQEAQAATAAHEGATPEQKKMLAAGGVVPPKATPESGPLTPQQQKLMEAADGGGKPGEGDQKPGETKKKKPGKGPNILGNFGTGYQIGVQNDPSATVSLLGHRAAAWAHGALAPSTPQEQARMQREAYQQRAEMLRQNSQQTQSAMQRSLAARVAVSEMPPVRSGLRRN